MAIYHCAIKVFSRSSGASAVGASAYRSGGRLENAEGRRFDYSRKGGVVDSFVMLPENAPAEFSDREKLWQSVEQVEKAKNAQLAREVEISLPIELDRRQQVALIRKFVQTQFVDYGMIADVAVHDKQDGNPHAHILLTTRPLKDGRWGEKERKEYALDENGKRIPLVDENGKQKVTRGRKMWKRVTIEATGWNRRENAEIWREAWAQACNEALRSAGSDERLDHRSYERQGLEIEPTTHIGAKKAKEGEYERERRESREDHNSRVETRNSASRQAARERERDSFVDNLDLERRASEERQIDVDAATRRAKSKGLLQLIRKAFGRLGGIVTQEQHKERQRAVEYAERKREFERVFAGGKEKIRDRQRVRQKGGRGGR